MKLLLDLLPVILFFAAFKLAGMQPDTSLALAQRWLGPLMIDGQVPAGQAPILLATAVAIVASLVIDGQVPAGQAPILLATAVAIVASLVQVGWQLVRRKKVDTMLLISVAVIVVFGGATIWLHDETFIKWKPSILYWLFGGILLGGRLLAGRNLLRTVLGEQLVLPAAVWERLLWLWIAFFTTIGAVNLIVAFSVPTETWVNFKLFGLMGITFAFTLGIGLWLARHMKEAGDA